MEDQAAVSGDEESLGSEGESGDEYEKDSFLASDDEEEGEDEVGLHHRVTRAMEEEQAHASKRKAVAAQAAKKPERAAAAKEAPPKSVAKASAKAASKPSSKPAAPPASKTPIVFRITVDNAQTLASFLAPIHVSCEEVRMQIVKSASYEGLRIEAHNKAKTIAIKSRFACRVELGAKATPADASFVVHTQAFKVALQSVSFKSQGGGINPLTITKYEGSGASAVVGSASFLSSDDIVFEAFDETMDISRFSCKMVGDGKTYLESMASFGLDHKFSVEMPVTVLKSISETAKTAKSCFVTMSLATCEDPMLEGVEHKKLSIGFTGEVLTGNRIFLISTRKGEDEEDEEEVIKTDKAAVEALSFTSAGSNNYRASVLKALTGSMVREGGKDKERQGKTHRKTRQGKTRTLTKRITSEYYFSLHSFLQMTDTVRMFVPDQDRQDMPLVLESKLDEEGRTRHIIILASYEEGS